MLSRRIPVIVRCSTHFRYNSIKMISHKLHTSVRRFQSENKAEHIYPPEIPGSGVAKLYPSHIVELVDGISRLNLLEVSELTELLQKKLNIQTPMAMMPTMTNMAATPAALEPNEEEQAVTKTSFTVKLIKFESTKKVAIIKEIKALLPEMNLVQAKKFVESAPGDVKSDVSKDEAEEIKKILEAAGATVEIE